MQKIKYLFPFLFLLASPVFAISYFGSLTYSDGGSPTCNIGGTGYPVGQNSSAFDGNLDTCAVDGGGWNSGTFIGEEFDEPVDVTSLDITFGTTQGPPTGGLLDLQYSDDGETWTTSGSSFSYDPDTGGTQTFTFPDNGAHLYWQVITDPSYDFMPGYQNFWLDELTFYYSGGSGSSSTSTIPLGFGQSGDIMWMLGAILFILAVFFWAMVSNKLTPSFIKHDHEY